MTGLTQDIQLTNGKFTFKEGSDKAHDGVLFLCYFDKYRVYSPNFGTNLLTFVMKPLSYLLANRTILLGGLAKSIRDNVPDVKVNNIDLGYTKDNRKRLLVKVDYSVTLADKTQVHNVTFV